MTHDPYSYDPSVFFDSFYRTMKVTNWISDRQTIGEVSEREAKHHYNSLENLILETVGITDFSCAAALDFGAGAGHWTDFALKILGVGSVKQVEVSKVAREHLLAKYAVDKRVVTVHDLYKTFGYNFDLIFAIGVMFHIVDDAVWESTLHRLIERLPRGGRLFVTDRFWDTTDDVQFHVTDHFSYWTECYGIDQTRSKFVHKRLRAMGEWKRVVSEAGAKVEHIWRNRAPAGYITPENNLMVVRKVE